MRSQVYNVTTYILHDIARTSFLDIGHINKSLRGIGLKDNIFLRPKDHANLNHGPLKLRTVHFGDITIIYESKVSEQNIFPWLKGTIESRPHTKFQINCLFK
jgi:hypothetical protein